MKKRLVIKIVGHDYITAFPNEKKDSPNQPDYKSDGVAVWIKDYIPKPKEETINGL